MRADIKKNRGSYHCGGIPQGPRSDSGTAEYNHMHEELMDRDPRSEMGNSYRKMDRNDEAVREMK
jgi:hypothetical protein